MAIHRLPRSTVYQRLADGRYRERYPAVFSMPGAPDSRLAWYQAAVLAITSSGRQPSTPLERDTANEFESLFVRIMTWEGAPPSAVNHPVTDADGRRRKLDAVYLPGDYPIEIPVWIELDGRFAHSEVLDVNDDRAREDALMRAGWPEPIRLTWQDLVRRPDEVVARVRDAIDPHRASRGSSQLD